jgi:hypothetical protein
MTRLERQLVRRIWFPHAEVRIPPLRAESLGRYPFWDAEVRILVVTGPGIIPTAARSEIATSCDAARARANLSMIFERRLTSNMWLYNGAATPSSSLR